MKAFLPNWSFATAVSSVGGPSPDSLSALTLKEYSLPSVSSPIVCEVFLPFMICFHFSSPSPCSKMYAVIKLPPSLIGFFQDRVIEFFVVF